MLSVGEQVHSRPLQLLPLKQAYLHGVSIMTAQALTVNLNVNRWLLMPINLDWVHGFYQSLHSFVNPRS